MVQLTCSVANFAPVTRIADFQGISEDTWVKGSTL